MARRLAGRVALVVGAGAAGTIGSIGQASAVAYAREGASVVAVDVVGAAAERTARLAEAEGASVMIVAADASVPAEMERAVSMAMDRFGRIDVLHNNVGVMAFGEVEDLSVEEWDRVTTVNGRSHFLAAKYALPHLEATGNGAVVNVSSIAGLRYTGAPYPAYAASKAATIGFTRALAVSHADRGVRVNCVVPGFVDSEMMRGGLAAGHGAAAVERMVAERAARLPMKRLARPEDIANACVFLASDEAAYVTGAVLVVDGGASASAAP